MMIETNQIQYDKLQLNAQPDIQNKPKEFSDFYKNIYNKSNEVFKEIEELKDHAAEYFVELIKKDIEEKANNGIFSIRVHSDSTAYNHYINANRLIRLSDVIDKVANLFLKEGFFVHSYEYSGSITYITIYWEDKPNQPSAE